MHTFLVILPALQSVQTLSTITKRNHTLRHKVCVHPLEELSQKHVSATRSLEGRASRPVKGSDPYYYKYSTGGAGAPVLAYSVYHAPTSLCSLGNPFLHERLFSVLVFAPGRRGVRACLFHAGNHKENKIKSRDVCAPQKKAQAYTKRSAVK